MTDEAEALSKGARTRAQITRAAIATLIDRGFAETSINRVIERADISKGALQHHFSTKEDLIAAVVETLLARPLDRPHPVRDNADRGDREIVAAELRSTWHDFINTGAYRALLEILVAARTDECLRRRIEPILHAWNQKIDQRLNCLYASATGDPADVELIMVMNRALLRGLILQDRYVDDPAYNLRVVERWIELAAPLLIPRQVE